MSEIAIYANGRQSSSLYFSNVTLNNIIYCYYVILFPIVINNISRGKIRFQKELGEGAFGRVYLGEVDDLFETCATTLVAVSAFEI